MPHVENSLNKNQSIQEIIGKNMKVTLTFLGKASQSLGMSETVFGSSELTWIDWITAFIKGLLTSA